MHNNLRETTIVVAALMMLCGCRERPGSASQTAAPPPKTGAVKIVRPSHTGSFADVVDALRPSIVHLRSKEPVTGGPAVVIPGALTSGIEEAKLALGSGFIIDTEGHILTNHHVLGNTTELDIVLFDGSTHAATIVGRDPTLDLALLKIAPVRQLKPVRTEPAASARVGEWIVVLGDPFGSEVTASAGIISSIGHLSHEAFAQPDLLNYLGFLQTDARIDATNSGGPVVNRSGKVVAIATASVELGDTVGYAIPVERAEGILGQLKASGTVARSYIGIYVDQVTDADVTRLGLGQRRGALVTDVVENGPAAVAGLRVDDVILRIDETDVDHASLPWIVSKAVVGTRLSCEVWRSGKLVQLSIVTVEMR